MRLQRVQRRPRRRPAPVEHAPLSRHRGAAGTPDEGDIDAILERIEQALTAQPATDQR